MSDSPAPSDGLRAEIERLRQQNHENAAMRDRENADLRSRVAVYERAMAEARERVAGWQSGYDTNPDWWHAASQNHKHEVAALIEAVRSAALSAPVQGLATPQPDPVSGLYGDGKHEPVLCSGADGACPCPCPYCWTHRGSPAPSDDVVRFAHGDEPYAGSEYERRDTSPAPPDGLRAALDAVYEFWKGRPDLAPGIRLREKVRAALSAPVQGLDAACPKCGKSDIYDSWEPSFGGREGGIDRRCRNCRYSWTETPLDARLSEQS